MSYSIDSKKLTKLVDLYTSFQRGEELKYMHYLGGQQQLYKYLETSPFQGITYDSIEQRKAWFGNNICSSQKGFSVFRILSISLQHLPIRIMLLFSISSIILQILIPSNNLVYGYLDGIVGLSVSVLSLFIILIMEGSREFDRSKLEDYSVKNGLCHVWRENKRIEIYSEQLVVGDVVQITADDNIYADGWLIQGSALLQQEQNNQYHKNVKKNMKACIYDIGKHMSILGTKRLIQLQQVEAKQVESRKIQYPSPIILSGSIVLEGEGKMIVICVGKNSKQGQFVQLIHQQNLPSKTNIECKIQNIILSLSKFIILLIIALIIVITLRFIVENLISKNWGSHLHEFVQQISTGVSIALTGIPAGFIIALTIGLKYIAFLMKSQGIIVRRAIHCQSMGGVTCICYDKFQDNGYFKVNEWWNQTLELVKQLQEKQQKRIICSQFDRLFALSLQISDSYKREEVEGGKQDTYIDRLDQSLIKFSKILYGDNEWIFKILNHFPSNKKRNKSSLLIETQGTRKVYIKGVADQILELCTHMISKTTGNILLITEQIRQNIANVMQKMGQKLLRTVILAYKQVKIDDSIIKSLHKIQSKGFVLLGVLGLVDNRNTTDFEIINNLRSNNIKMIMVSSNSMSQTMITAQELGIIKLGSPSSVCLKGKDFMRIVGGTICIFCKYTICRCQQIDQNSTKVKKHDSFERLFKHLQILSEANAMEKHTLVTGLTNVSSTVAIVGSKIEDIAALRKADVGIFIQGYDIEDVAMHAVELELQNDNPSTIYDAIKYGRFSYKFIQNFLMLSLTPCLVGFIISIISIILYKRQLIKVIQILWVNCLIIPILSIGLVLQQVNPQLMNDKPYTKKQSLLNKSLWKQIITQITFQLFILCLLLTMGHLIIPQSFDQIDNIIGSDILAKYNSYSKSTIVSGTWYYLNGQNQNYSIIFQKYQIYSRHSTILFNLFSIFQIFNFFNSRKFYDSQINIFLRLKISQAIVVCLVIIIQILCINFGNNIFGFYKYGLTISQWAITIGLGMTSWIVAVIIKLIPNFNHDDDDNQKIWPNKSYNLAVKATNSTSVLADFEVDQELMFKPKQ